VKRGKKRYRNASNPNGLPQKRGKNAGGKKTANISTKRSKKKDQRTHRTTKAQPSTLRRGRTVSDAVEKTFGKNQTIKEHWPRKKNKMSGGLKFLSKNSNEPASAENQEKKEEARIS